MNFCKETVIHQLVFGSPRYQYVDCYSRAGGTEWAHQKAKVLVEHSLFVDDLKVYEESHDISRDVNEVIVQASHDTGACYGISKCAEIVFDRGKMVRGEGLEVLKERMKTMDSDENEIYKFLGIEQADGIKTKKVFERVKGEVNKRVKMLTNTELNDVNLVRAITRK